MFKRKLCFCIYLGITILLFSSPISGHADSTSEVRIDGEQGEYDVTAALLILEDKERILSSVDVFDPGISGRFVPYKDSKFAGEISASAYWAKVVIGNGTDEVQNMFLDISKPHLNNISLYIYDQQRLIKEIKAGRDFPFGHRDIRHRNFVFEIKLMPKTAETILLRVETKSYLQLPVKLYSSRAFVEKQYDTQLFLGIYYGIMLAMFLYNLVLFLALKDRVYLYYILYILWFSMLQLVWDGFAFQFLWPGRPDWDVRSNPFFIVLTSYFALQFSRSFLHVSEKSGLADKLINGILIVLAFVGALALIIPPELTLKLSVYSATLALVMCIANIRIVGFHNKSVYLYSIAWGAIFIGVLLNLLSAYGLLPVNIITLYSPRVGSAIEVVLLSLALVNRFNRMRQEKIMEQKQKVLLKSLHEITKTLTSTHDLDILLKYILRSLSEVTKYENGIIILKQGQSFNIKDSLGYAEADLKDKLLDGLEQDKSFMTIIGMDKAVTLVDVNMACYGINRTAKTFTGIPISYHKQLLGLIVLYSMSSKDINDIENQIIYDFAGQVGITIQNIMLFERVKKMATIDGLTGAFNRIHFTGLAELALMEQQRTGSALSVIMLDIDDFKQINDSYGHIAGDKVLRELVNCMREILGPESIIGRYGGEEFLVLLSETSPEEAYLIAENLRMTVEKMRIYLDEKRVVKFTISIGISDTSKHSGNVWSLVEKADEALYMSKQKGKNLVNIC